MIHELVRLSPGGPLVPGGQGLPILVERAEGRHASPGIGKVLVIQLSHESYSIAN